jgi:hypothetical protein
MENRIVGVDRRVLGDKQAEVFLQRAYDKFDDESLGSNGNNSRKQASEEMHTAMMETDGDTACKTMNLSGVSGRPITDTRAYLIELYRDYAEWSALMNAKGTAKSLTRQFARGNNMTEIAREYGLHPKKVERLIHYGLDAFANIRGYGKKEKIHIPATKPQLELMEIIGAFQRKHGVSPTLDELAKIKSVSKTAIHYMVRRMGNRGLLSYVEARERSIVLL